MQRLQLFHDGGLYHIETNPLIGSANQQTGFYMTETSVIKELKHLVARTRLRVAVNAVVQLLF